MAFPKTLIFLVVLISITSSISSAQIISRGILGGVLTCANTLQELIDLVCGNGSLARVIQSVLTNTAGVYSFVFTTLDTVLNDPGSCYLRATVPSTSCNFNVPTGILRIPIVVLRVVDVLVGRLLILVPGALSFVVGI
ncbi:hypothetical protein CDL12_06050 [Handroanthus impetiginosus]|uniref:Uncharacterized protein n=1 Tax=Handroanthus impetiginosus TaxID=429701 RepID=A0A2G9HVB3_9LAMI|nr:hypothetical protein CDL12_06050 [Handroanthus impetiginosus]